MQLARIRKSEESAREIIIEVDKLTSTLNLAFVLGVLFGWMWVIDDCWKRILKDVLDVRVLYARIVST